MNKMTDANENSQKESNRRKLILQDSEGSFEIVRRIAIFPKKIPDRFAKGEKKLKLIPTFPNLIIREIICFQIVLIVVILISLFFNAPLAQQANPNNTPNPAKAPWYFLGLQELLHDFPPFVAGILIPGLIIVALIVLPYFNVNLKREGWWRHNKQKKLLALFLSVILISATSLIFHAYAIAVSTILIFAVSLLPYFITREKGWLNWLGQRPISDWIMTWFVILVIVLTIIGTYFRGKEWSWIWPW